MIADSIPWKEELLRTAADLERRRNLRRVSERSMFLFERNVMTAAYSARKLIEARKVSDALARKSWPVEKYKRTGPVPDAWNNWEPERLYDFSAPVKASLSTLEICHQIVHSYIFLPVWGWDEATRRRGTLEALAFVSDKWRRSHLFSIRIETLINLIAEVGDEDIVGLAMRSDENGERRIVEVVGVGRGDPGHWSRHGAAQPRA